MWLVFGGLFRIGSRLGSRPLADIPALHGFPGWIIRGVEYRVSIATTWAAPLPSGAHSVFVIVQPRFVKSPPCLWSL